MERATGEAECLFLKSGKTSWGSRLGLLRRVCEPIDGLGFVFNE